METPLLMKVPLLDLKAEYAELRDDILAALDRVCQKSAFVLGEEVEAFEREFAAFCGTKHCVALATGTAALHLGLLALGVQPGDEVITTPNTFIAAAEAITYCGAQPVFVDIDPATTNLDPKLIEAALQGEANPPGADTFEGPPCRFGPGPQIRRAQTGARPGGRLPG